MTFGVADPSRGSREAAEPELLAWAGEVGRRHGAAADPDVIRRTDDAWIIGVGQVVVKVHHVATVRPELAARLAVAHHRATRRCLLAPLDPRPLTVPTDLGPGRRWASVWPRVQPLTPRPQCVPWRRAGRLLAELHTAIVPSWPLPAHRAAERLPRALARLNRETAHAHAGAGVPAPLRSATTLLREAVSGLPAAAETAQAPERPRTLVHGDWHLGQLGCLGTDAVGRPRWLLLDVDDLGSGDPAWDLARPAGFWAAGLLPDEDWHAFLDGYREARGPAVAAGAADPWPPIEVVSRRCVIEAAIKGVRRALSQHADLDDVDHQLLDAVARMPTRT